MSYVTQVVNPVCTAVVNSGLSAAIGYLCARTFMSINPINGAVYAAIFPLVSAVTTPIFNSLFQGKEANGATRFVGTVLNMTANVGASYSISGAVGFPLTFGAAATLTVIPAAIVMAAAAVGFGVSMGVALKAS